MIAVFTLLYVAGIWLFYVKLKIKPRPTNIAVASVIGVVAIGAIVIFWQFSAPMSGRLVVARYTVQIVPQVGGPIERIHAEPNVPLRKGKDVLFEIQKTPYQYTVDQLTASLEAAKRNVEQLEAGVRVADAAINEAVAGQKASDAELATAKETRKLNVNAISTLKVTQLQQQFDGAEATVAKAKAGREQAVAALEAARSTVESTAAQLKNAQFDLDQCTVYAPADGFVTNWQAREGTMAVKLPLSPMGVFVDTSRTELVANFGQNTVKNVRPGDKVEIAVKSRPGEIFTGTVKSVIQASGEGQFVTSGTLPSAATIGSKGMFAVTFDLDDEEVARSLAMGTAGVVAIYTSTGKPFQVISKVTVRIKAWMYYLIPM